MNEARVTVVASEPEAEMTCGLLRSQGIDCYFRRTNFGAGAADGMLSGFGQTEILVRASDLDEAREILGLEDSGCA